MSGTPQLAKLLILVGSLIVIVGIVMLLMGRIPGDILIKRGNFIFYFPIVTSIILSLILTLILNWLRK